MLTLEKKIKILELMERAADEMLPNGYEKEVKQSVIEDDKWEQHLEIRMYDKPHTEEWYKNIDPIYSVICSSMHFDKDKGLLRSPYEYIEVYKGDKEVGCITVTEAKMYYNN